MERAAVVIVGGGVIGASIAFHLGGIVSDLYLGREPYVDVSPMAAGRNERPERNVV
jgi:hypothetical protein